MSRSIGLARINEHGPGHPLAWIVWSVPAFFFLYEYVLRIIPGVIERDLEKEFHLDEAGIGGIMGMYYYAYAPMQLVVGVLLDRFGARILLAGAAMFCAIGLVVFSMASTSFGLAVSRILIGFGSSFAFIGAVYVAMVWFPERKVALLTGLTAGLGFGIGVLTEWFAADLLGNPPQWRSAMLVLAISGMVIGVGVLVVVPHRPAWYLDRTGIEEGRTLSSAIKGLLAILRRRSIWLISLACALMYLPLPLAANWGPRSISELLSVPEQDSSKLFAWFYLGVAIGCPVAGWLSDRMGRRKPLLICGAIFASILVIIIAIIPGLDTNAIGLLLLGLGLATGTYVLGYPMAAELGPAHSGGSAIAFVNFIGMLLAGGFVWVFGIIVDAYARSRGHGTTAASDDFQSMLLITGCMMIGAVLLLLFVRERQSSRD